MVKQEKKNKITFSEEIDSKITGFAMVLAFLSIGIFLLFFPNYFGNTLISEIVRYVFIAIGIIGCIIEFKKPVYSNIKGFDDFVIGTFLIAVWLILFLFVNLWWVNIVSFLVLPFVAYGLFKGLLEMIYSAISAVQNKKESKKNISTDIILLLTKFAGLILVLVQIIKAIGVK